MQTLPIRFNKTWKLVICTEDPDDASEELHEWVIADLARESEHFTLDVMRSNEGKGNAIDIVNLAESDDNAAILRTLNKFQDKWLRYALELGIQFEVEDHVKEWAKDLEKTP